MDATTSASLNQIVSSLEPLKSFNKSFLWSPEFWGSIIASLTALFIAVGGARVIKRLIGIRPELKLIGFKRYHQATYYWRLAIKNSGKEVAKKVQVNVTAIYDDGKKRENFLAIPLRWTHLNCESRDILPSQTVYLDVVEHIISKDGDEAKLITRRGGGVDDFEVLKKGESKVILTFYEKSGISFDKQIEISRNDGLLLDGRIKGKKWHLTKKFC